MFSIFFIVNLILIIVLAILTFHNRHMENQKLPRILFVIIIAVFLLSIIF